MLVVRQITLGPKSALHDVALYDTLLSFTKLREARMVRGTKLDNPFDKLSANMETLAERESFWLLAAFELMYDRPELSIMLGGTGLEQVSALANMLKQEGDREYAKDLFRDSSLKVMRALGPLGLGQNITIKTRCSELIYHPNASSTSTDIVGGMWDFLKKSLGYGDEISEDIGTWPYPNKKQ
ncbi:hypothetical protein RFI_17742 [Reticulomyxa filosa]|uniref:Uncharacterized protein n=1 Tax=Reticulomyxa filosa TaxID=46433 RepID=X6N2E9_RETFI|nr:hypothetical protein RFI_17742 [Reticulomyxa filosa]|eukprot:ETO19487.1 hypothetical protein RFI_17742 [Reticulomyxa filosa]